MSVADADVYFDPWNDEIMVNPYPVFRRLRDEAPLYYNERHDFYAVSRFADVQRALSERESFINSKGGVIEVIRMGIEIPRGLIVFEDPPIHTIHRGLLSRVFTPRAMLSIEPEVRDYTSRTLDRLMDRTRFDVISEIGSRIPMRVIGMLLGIPEDDQEGLRSILARSMEHPDQGEPLGALESSEDMFGTYIDWRTKNPADDLMTKLLNSEFTDETGTTRRLERNELVTLVNVLAGAGIDTTNRLIGWTASLLSEHPAQRRVLVENPALIGNAIEEILRFESPSYYEARWVTHDVEFHGQTVPAESILALMPASGNRDERQFHNPDTFDVERKVGQILTFGFGAHYCLGAALARLEGRVVLDEMLKRWPDWEVDTEESSLFSAAFFRGWEKLPIAIP